MNEAGMKRAEELDRRTMTLAECRKQLVRLKNMALLCHCSAEIDQGTLLYFSVNHMFLGKGDCFVVLFSEVESRPVQKDRGEDLYGRVYLYGLVDEILTEVLDGHFSYYSAELDGRLAAIIHFPLGLLPTHARDIPYLLRANCARISHLCQERYGLHVVAYLSDRITDISTVSVVYHKLLNLVTLHRYLQTAPAEPVFTVSPPEPSQANEPFPVRQLAQGLANAVVEGKDYHTLADQALTRISEFTLFSADELRTRFGDLFEAFCAELRFRGVRVQEERLRRENFSLINEAHTWQEHVAWFHSVLDRLAQSSREGSRDGRKLSISRLQSCVDDHIQDVNLNTALLAERTGLPLHAVKLAFRQQLQTSPTRYIRTRRLELAARLLREEGLTLEEIRARCGFGSLGTFHRSFREEYGIAPGKFRRLSQGG